MRKLLNETNFKKIMEAKMNNGIIMVNNMNTANKLLEETEAHQAFVVNASSKGYMFGNDDRPERVTKSFFAATAQFLHDTKIKDPKKAVALTLTTVSGEFLFGAVVQYNENKDNPDEPGNWSYITTFDEADIEAIESKRSVKKMLYSDDFFKNVFNTVVHDVGGIVFKDALFMYDACLITIESILQVLDKEAVVGETVNIELPGYFVATVEVDGDEKIFGITPDGAMKEVIKSDADL